MDGNSNLRRSLFRMIKKLSRDDRFIGGSDYYHYDGPEF